MPRPLHSHQIVTSCSTGCCSSKTETQSNRKSCNKHRTTAFERYAITLEAIGCICKALVARNLESCCSTGCSIRRRGYTRLGAEASTSSICSAKSSRCSENRVPSSKSRTSKPDSRTETPTAYGVRTGPCMGATEISKSNSDSSGETTGTARQNAPPSTELQDLKCPDSC